MRNKKGMTRKGILAGGNWIVDQVKRIDVYPQPEQLANIQHQTQGTGGSPYNVSVGLARLGVSFPLTAAGLVGADDLGRSIIETCRHYRIGTQWLGRTAKAPTSYTDVMTEQSSGRRTFFHMRGANALWTGAEIDFHRSRARIFHLGYLLLLDALDRPDKRHGTRAAALLARARAAGLKTCVDVVSEESRRFEKIVVPALKQTDYCILNELEAGNTTGIQIRRAGGALDTAALRKASARLLAHGVRELVAIHFPEGGFVRTQEGWDYWQGSVKVPARQIVGAAGAGDGFCAGFLLGLHEGWDLARCLETAVCVAAASLSALTCTDGIKSLRSAMALGKKFGYRAIKR